MFLFPIAFVVSGLDPDRLYVPKCLGCLTLHPPFMTGVDLPMTAAGKEFRAPFRFWITP